MKEKTKRASGRKEERRSIRIRTRQTRHDDVDGDITAVSRSTMGKEEEEEDYGALIYRESQLRKAEAAVAAAAVEASKKKKKHAASSRRPSSNFNSGVLRC